MSQDLQKRMDGALASLQHEFGGLRTGRASPNLLDHIQVEAYGAMMPMNQVGTVNAPEARMLVVQVWDKTMVKAVEKAIANANLGVNPVADGQIVRVPIPALSEERRKELTKLAGKYAENAKVAIRNVRRDGMDELKAKEKAKQISEDQMHGDSEKIQKLTDDYIKKVDDALATKEKDIMSV